MICRQRGAALTALLAANVFIYSVILLNGRAMLQGGATGATKGLGLLRGWARERLGPDL